MNNVREIVRQYLIAVALDGLYSEIGECGCGLSDLMPCDSPCDECEPAYETYCPSCGGEVFVPVRACRNQDEGKKLGLGDLFGILEGDKPQTSTEEQRA